MPCVGTMWYISAYAETKNEKGKQDDLPLCFSRRVALLLFSSPTPEGVNCNACAQEKPQRDQHIDWILMSRC